MEELLQTAAPAIEQAPPVEPAAPNESQAQEVEKPEEPKPEDRSKKLENALSRKRQQLADERAEKAALRRENEELRTRLTRAPIVSDNGGAETDSDLISLPRAKFEQAVEERAKSLAPTLAEQAEAERSRGAAARSAATELGHEKWLELTDDLAAILPAEHQLSILDTEAPAALVQYLTDPENEEEARRIARMNPYRAGAAMDRLAQKLASKPKPQPSKAAAPVEAVKASGTATGGLQPGMSYEQFVKRRNEQIRARKP